VYAHNLGPEPIYPTPGPRDLGKIAGPGPTPGTPHPAARQLEHLAAVPTDRGVPVRLDLSAPHARAQMVALVLLVGGVLAGFVAGVWTAVGR
jgi:hypothetical protein